MSDPYATQHELVLEGSVSASGELTLTIDPRQWSETWILTQVTVDMPNAPAGALCRLEKSGRLITPIIPSGSAAGGDPPILLRPGETAAVRWTGATPGARGSVLVIYDVVSAWARRRLG